MKFRYAWYVRPIRTEAWSHSLLKRHGFDVSSYGTGSHVKLPGPSLREQTYKRNGILPMLKRNSGVKLAPQRWQDNAADGSFTVVLTFEEKVFDMFLKIEQLNHGDSIDEIIAAFEAKHRRKLGYLRWA
uniref:RNA polymerase II subunit A C-terminal domain phosphatase SSU72 n=1 Tax=Salix viminalis TaxID=40686 RepID=A0A6N2MX31_SALVM